MKWERGKAIGNRVEMGKIIGYWGCKGKVSHAPQESIVGAHLPRPGHEPVGREPLMSVTRGQCDARPMVTFPAARHHHPLAGTKLYCLVTEAHVC